MMRMVRPAHPGQFIKMEVIEPLNLSVTQAAKVLGVTRSALSALLNGRAALSPEMALRIEKAFGPKMDTLLRMRIPLIPATHSGGFRPGIPIHPGHLFRSMPATLVGAKRRWGFKISY